LAVTVDIPKLCSAIRVAREALRGPRQWRYDIAKQVAGDRFSPGGAEAKVKLNLLALYHETFSNLLVANEPRFVLSTPDRPSRAAVRVEQDWLNEQAERMQLGTTGRLVVSDALMATGICKVALATPCEAATLAWGITAGEPIALAIDFDDFVYDTAARTFAEAQYIGHRFRCPVRVVKAQYKKKIADLSADEEVPSYNQEGDLRINQIMIGNTRAEEFEEQIDLWEIYLPQHRLVVTLADKDVLEGGSEGIAKALWTQPWVGPPWGPYLFLCFGRVAGAAIAKAPMMDLYELHMDLNNIRRKAATTLRNLKENIIYRRSNSADAQELQKANHLDYVPVEDPTAIASISMGGQLVQPLLTAAAEHQQAFNYLGGNLSLIGGRSAQSETATQDKILNANAGMSIQAMQGKVETFMSLLGKSMLWFAHHHPELVMESEYTAPGAPAINRRLYPAGDASGPSRDFSFWRSKFRLDPYSIRHRTPEERLAFIGTVVQQLTPMLPILAAQNIQLDANCLVELMAEFGDAPEIRKLFTVRAIQGQEQGAGPRHDKTLPAETERTYTRQSLAQPEGADQKVAELSATDFTKEGVAEAAA
jgi:hypothetical protein